MPWRTVEAASSAEPNRALIQRVAQRSSDSCPAQTPRGEVSRPRAPSTEIVPSALTATAPIGQSDRSLLAQHGVALQLVTSCPAWSHDESSPLRVYNNAFADCTVKKPCAGHCQIQGIAGSTRLPEARSTRLPLSTPKSLTAAFRGFRATALPPASSERKVACCPRYPAVLRFARLFATNSRAWVCAASPAHAA